MPEQNDNPPQDDSTQEPIQRECRDRPWWAARWTFRAIVKAIIALSLVWATIFLLCVAIFSTGNDKEMTLALLAIAVGMTTTALNHYYAKDQDE